MKKIILSIGLSVLAMSAFAQQKPCEELKSEIDAKLQAKGVKNYTLEVIETANVKDEKIVGSCEGGTKKIAYKRN